MQVLSVAHQKFFMMGALRMCVSCLFGICKMFRRRSLWMCVFASLVVIILVLDLLTTKSVHMEKRLEPDQTTRRYSDVRISSSVLSNTSLQSMESNNFNWTEWKHAVLNHSFWNLVPNLGKSNFDLVSNNTGHGYSLHLGPGLEAQGLDTADYPSLDSDTAESNKDRKDEDSKFDGSILRLLVLGDYGGRTDPPYTTPIQLAVAKAMEKIASTTSVHGVLSPGDNFYEDGVKDLKDPHFNASFEKVYRGSLLHKPWFTMAGNHDYTGNVSAQIAYTNISERWYFPWYNYQVTWDLNSSSDTGKVTIVMVDTILLCGNCGRDNALDPPHGPSDPVLAENIWTWFEDTLREASGAYHLVVVGHFPVLSAGLHGPTACLEERMLPLLHKYRVSAYITGHDHNMQHIFSSSLDYAWDVDHYVVGSGAKVETKRSHIEDIPGPQLLFYNDEKDVDLGAGGFALMEMDYAWMNFTFYNSKSQPLHRHSTQARQHRTRQTVS